MSEPIAGPDGQVLFRVDELACKGSGVLRLHPGFADELRTLRLRWARPMRVTSCCRSTAHNTAEGGAANSLHVYDVPSYPGQQGTLAIDVAVSDPVTRWELVFIAMGLGWSVGMPQKGRGFMHFDRRDMVGQPRLLFDY